MTFENVQGRGPESQIAAFVQSREIPTAVFGFTLIELVVVLAVIMIIASFVAPALLNTTRTAAPSSVEALRKLLVASQRQSEQDASEVEVFYVPESGRYRVEEHRAGTPTRIARGVLEISDAQSEPAQCRFHVAFRSTGIGVGDSLVVGSDTLRVDPILGTISIRQ